MEKHYLIHIINGQGKATAIADNQVQIILDGQSEIRLWEVYLFDD